MNYKSQYGQDKYLHEIFFNGKRNGIFVDIGAHNGVNLSNTYFFEKELDWKGICFEPNPNLFQDLEINRKSINIKGCAWSSNEERKFRLISGYSEMLSGLIDTYDSRHLQRIEKECFEKDSKYIDLDVNCFEINSILSKHNFFKIDLLSIDTEGSEFDILKHINYNLFHIDVILVENNYKDNIINEFLSKNGYYLHSKIKIDDVFKRIE